MISRNHTLHYVAPAPATSTTMEIVRLLVDAGADPTYTNHIQNKFGIKNIAFEDVIDERLIAGFQGKIEWRLL
jgi:spore coat polysaccharide biosynthesis protein SpsF (cytidylyltransferase family)